MTAVTRLIREAETVEGALALCAANNDCSVHSTMQCIDAERSYRGSWTLTAIDGVIVSRTRRLSLRYERADRHIAGDGDDSVMVYFNAGHSWMNAEQLGRSSDVRPGGGGLWVHNEAVTGVCGEGADFYGIGIPRSLTALWARTPEDLVGQSFDTRAPVHQLLRVYMDTLGTCADLDSGVAAAMKVHIAELAGLWLGGLNDSHWRDAYNSERQQAKSVAIRQVMLQRLADPTLSAAFVGRALGFAERTVQHILTLDGTSFTRLLGQLRAEAAYAMLTDPARRTMPVAAIAMACGFNDVSTFYRAFRMRYDAHPRDIRSSA